MTSKYGTKRNYMLFFTADEHFDHSNIIQLSNRPFSSVEEMNEKLISNWNEVVTAKDTGYIIGDFAFKNPEKHLARLNGKIIRIKGSHDNDIREPYMLSIYPGLRDEYGNPRTITLCHYSMRSWDRSHYASWHLFGHHHGKLEPYGLSFDVGVDTNNFYPYSLEDVVRKMSTLKPIVDFRK
jgi:calcineurin-like phosphoesterase family protein